MSDEAKGRLRRLSIEDISSALELSAEAGWNQTADDWRLLLELAPQSCLAIEVDGELATTTTLLCYGTRLAWVGMVLTKIKFRGQGLARRLLSETLKLASVMNIETLKLDATDQGKALYESMGFRSEQPVERWVRYGDGTSVGSHVQRGCLSSELLAFDHEAFAADRSPLLKRLAEHAPDLTDRKAYLLARPGRRMAYLGPCVSDNAGMARSLIEQWVQGTASSIAWDLLARNRDSQTIARDLGFAPERSLTRMVRGKELRGREESIYALGGFEFG